jgi:hypothetical protein
MELRKIIKADFDAFRANENQSPSPVSNDMRADCRLVGYATGAMNEKLRIYRSKGRGGWWKQKECSLDFLRELLTDHVQKGDMVDVMNIAAMIFVREIIDAPPTGEMR